MPPPPPVPLGEEVDTEVEDDVSLLVADEDDGSLLVADEDDGALLVADEGDVALPVEVMKPIGPVSVVLIAASEVADAYL